MEENTKREVDLRGIPAELQEEIKGLASSVDNFRTRTIELNPAPG